MTITVKDASELAQAISPALALFALIFTLRVGIQTKRADIMMECHRRFDALSEQRHELTKRLRASNESKQDQTITDDIKSWSRRFWSLQFDQYEFWRRGLIDNDFFRYWMVSRHRDFEKALDDKSCQLRTFEVLAFESGFHEVSITWPDTNSPRYGDFKGFMKEIRKNCIVNIMEKHQPWFPRRWGFWG